MLTERSFFKRLTIIGAAVFMAVSPFEIQTFAADDISLKIGNTTLTFNYLYPVLENGEDASILSGIDLFAKNRIQVWSDQRRDPFCILNRSFIFEQTVIDDEAAKEYVDIVDKIAEELPEVNVYNMIVPDAYELYAPKKYSTGQIDMINNIYRRLRSAEPVDVTYALAEHADEKIFFNTDHHWTQRGAYYAWARFMEQKGMSVSSLSEFKEINTSMMGSFASMLSSEERLLYLDSPTEEFERFMPIYDTVSKVYGDMEMQEYIYDAPVLNLGFNDYASFLTGDNPLTVIDSGVDNGKSIAVIKESVGNPLCVWAVNNYDKIYVIDIRGFEDGTFNIKDFYDLTGFDDLLIESYPTTIASDDLRGHIKALI